MRRQQRPGVVQFARQQTEALITRKSQIIRAHLRPGKDLGQGVRVPAGVLAHVQRGQVQPEHLDQADQVLHRVRGRGERRRCHSASESSSKSSCSSWLPR